MERSEDIRGGWRRRVLIGAAVLLGLPAAVLVAREAPRFAARVASGSQGHAVATAQTMRVTEAAIKAYRADFGVYPANLREITVARFMEGHFTDSWNNELEYITPGPNGAGYVLISAGVDGDFGTGDDVIVRGP